MVRKTLDQLKENLPVCDRYFVKRHGAERYSGIDGSIAPSDFSPRETEETGKPLFDILTDLRLAGCL